MYLSQLLKLYVSNKSLPIDEGLLDDTLNWLLLDCTVVAVQETEEVAEEVAMTTLLASIKASWKLYRHFFFAAFFFSLLSVTAVVSLLDVVGSASGLISESAGANISLPSIETQRVIKNHIITEVSLQDSNYTFNNSDADTGYTVHVGLVGLVKGILLSLSILPDNVGVTKCAGKYQSRITNPEDRILRMSLNVLISSKCATDIFIHL